MKCGIEKNFWLDDSYVSEKFGVMCALLVLYTIVFEEHTLQDVGVMCALLVTDFNSF
jgi:hypothetical protein